MIERSQVGSSFHGVGILYTLDERSLLNPPAYFQSEVSAIKFKVGLYTLLDAWKASKPLLLVLGLVTTCW